MQFLLYEKSDKSKIYGFNRETNQLQRREYQKHTVSWEKAKELCNDKPAFEKGFYVIPGYLFIDLDGVVSGIGEIHPKAIEILAAINKQSYAEYSLSKHGIHILAAGTLKGKPIDHRLDNEFWKDNTKKYPSIEVYGSKRYCALTFDFFPGFNTTFKDLPEINIVDVPYTIPFLPVLNTAPTNGHYVDNGSRHNKLVEINRALYQPNMSLEEFSDKLITAAQKSMPEADFNPFFDKRKEEIVRLYESCKAVWVPRLKEREQLKLLDTEPPEIPEELLKESATTGKKKLSYKLHPNKVAEDFIEKRRCFTKNGKKYTMWNGNRWAVNEEPFYLAGCIEKFIFQEHYNWNVVGKGEEKKTVIVNALKTTDLNEVVEHAKRQCGLEWEVNPKANSWFDKTNSFAREHPYIVAVQNGLLSVTTGKIVSPHTIDFYNTGILPCMWIEDALAPRFLDGLRTMFAGDTEEAIDDNIHCLQLWFGYLFLVGYSEKKLCVLLGDSNSGKSTLLRVMEILVGEQYYKALSLKELDGTRTDAGVGFDTHFLGGFDEFPFDKRLSGITDMIKMYTGDTKIAQRGLYKESQSVEMLMRLVLTSNTQPSFFSDPMGGLMNRLLIWNCKAVPREKQDPNYLRYLRENELSGILRWAIEGAQQVLRGVRLRQPGGESGELYQEFKDSTWGHIENWAQEAFIEDYNGIVTNDEMFEKLHKDTGLLEHKAFKTWLEKKEWSRKTTVSEIRKVIRNTVFPNVRKYENNSVRGFRGIAVAETLLSKLS